MVRNNLSFYKQRPPKLLVGTSGWVYPDWVGRVYPKDLKGEKIFEFYKKRFSSVELNSTFYHFPRATTVKKWKTSGGPDFIWSVKAWRWITHIKKLKDVKKDTTDFFERVKPLLANGVVLFQLPPSLKCNLEKLEGFLKILPRGIRTAIEFRHNSWFEKPTYELLKKYKAALVGVDAPKITRVLDERTAPFAYFRFHGSTQWYFHDYSKEELKVFAQAAKKHLKTSDLYVYFDNTAGGHAFFNAMTFRKLVIG